MTFLAPAALADPTDPAPADPASSGGPDPAATELGPGPVDDSDAIRSACRTFGSALDLAATNYEDFAYATAGNGDSVNYDNPEVLQSNQPGRTALRVAAHAAMDAAGTPGLPNDIGDPMRSWSLHATKLVLIMGLHGGGDSLNSAATALNADAHDTQMACATHGAH
ncbi:hypothetical protein [Mycolicibacterium sarraceniae]|nr:hypothetical protein [Mycolicibacterium sarraceniae]